VSAINWWVIHFFFNQNYKHNDFVVSN
jgi:hypothetical protein